jgi:hypothetical protein
MSFVIIESPYSGEIQRNIAYAQRAMNNSRTRDEIPMVPHLTWTQHQEAAHYFVGDFDQHFCILGRNTSIQQLKIIRRKVDKVIFMIDYGFSSGMIDALDQCMKEGIPYEERILGNTQLDSDNARYRTWTWFFMQPIYWLMEKIKFS